MQLEMNYTDKNNQEKQFNRYLKGHDESWLQTRSTPSLRQQSTNRTHDSNGGLADVSSYPAETLLACWLDSHDAKLTPS